MDLKIFLREHGIERTKLLLGDGLERAKVHSSMGIAWIGVRPWGNGVEACGDRSSRGIDERLHFVLRVDRGGTRLIAQGVVATGLNSINNFNFWFIT